MDKSHTIVYRTKCRSICIYLHTIHMMPIRHIIRIERVAKEINTQKRTVFSVNKPTTPSFHINHISQSRRIVYVWKCYLADHSNNDHSDHCDTSSVSGHYIVVGEHWFAHFVAVAGNSSEGCCLNHGIYIRKSWINIGNLETKYNGYRGKTHQGGMSTFDMHSKSRAPVSQSFSAACCGIRGKSLLMELSVSRAICDCFTTTDL